MTDQGVVGAPSKNEAESQKQFAERITELRKSCETLGGWCLGSIIATCLRTTAGAPNKVAMTCGVVGVVVGLVGSSPVSKNVNQSALTAHLNKTYRYRTCARYATILALLGGLIALLVPVLWS